MVRTIMTVLVVLLLLHILAVLGFFGFSVVTGRFSPDYRGQYLATWKGQKLVPYVEEEVVETKEESSQAASERIAETQISRELLSRQIQNRLQDLKNREVTIAAAQAKLDKDLKKLDIARSQFESKLAEHNKKAKEEGFGKVLKTYSEMNPKLVKDDFMMLDEEQVVRYLAAMKPTNRTDVLSKFKTPEEQAKRIRLLEQLNHYGEIKIAGTN